MKYFDMENELANIVLEIIDTIDKLFWFIVYVELV